MYTINSICVDYRKKHTLISHHFSASTWSCFSKTTINQKVCCCFFKKKTAQKVWLTACLWPRPGRRPCHSKLKYQYHPNLLKEVLFQSLRKRASGSCFHEKVSDMWQSTRETVTNNCHLAHQYSFRGVLQLEMQKDPFAEHPGSSVSRAGLRDLALYCFSV